MSNEKNIPVAGTPSEAARSPAGTPSSIVKRRGSAMAARGEPAIWITGLALKLCVVLIVVLLGVIVSDTNFGVSASRVDLRRAKLALRRGEVELGTLRGIGVGADAPPPSALEPGHPFYWAPFLHVGLGAVRANR